MADVAGKEVVYEESVGDGPRTSLRKLPGYKIVEVVARNGVTEERNGRAQTEKRE